LAAFSIDLIVFAPPSQIYDLSEDQSAGKPIRSLITGYEKKIRLKHTPDSDLLRSVNWGKN